MVISVLKSQTFGSLVPDAKKVSFGLLCFKDYGIFFMLWLWLDFKLSMVGFGCVDVFVKVHGLGLGLRGAV